MASNKTACAIYATNLDRAWAETAYKREKLLELSKLPNPIDQQCDDLIEWAADVCRVLLPEEE